ncbi:MAG TPA: hypothetical protein VM638_03170 [Actinomycetota bacterium]|nr:hypothetical protein [Actinomycetota bacterium]
MGWLKDLFFVNEEKEAAREAGRATPKAPPARPKASSTVDAATDDIIRRYAGGGGAASGERAPAVSTPAPDVSPPRSPSGEPPPDFGVAIPLKEGKVDFPEVFRKAGIPADDMDRVEKALALLTQLPAETPHATKKQIVETSLKAFNIPIEEIIETAVAEIQALHGCIDTGAKGTAALLSESEARIRKLEEEILEVRKVVEAAKSEQRALESAARAEGLRIQRILEFFGEETVENVVKDPSAPLQHSRDAKK